MNIPTFLRDVNINRQLTEEDIRYNKLCEKAKKDREARLKETKKILFGYMQSPSYGEIAEDDGGFSIDVYKDGNVIYRTYIFDNIEKTTEVFYISKRAVKRIKNIINNNSRQIKKLKYCINSDDGYIDEFIFKGKRIVALNVCDYRIKFLNQIMILLITQKFIYKLKKWSLKKWLK